MDKVVDVLIVTYNSSRTLKKCLQCIKNAVPYNRIIVGDGGSNDRTIEIAKHEGAEVYSFPRKDNLIGRIRYKLAEKAEKDWMLYVDSDVYLYQNFWTIMRCLIRPNVGMAFAVQDSPARTLNTYLTSRKLGFITFGNTIVPRHLMLVCKEMLNLNGGEDVFFAKFVKKRGYEVICLNEHLSFHDKSEEDLDRKFSRWARELGEEKLLMKFILLELSNIRNMACMTIKDGTISDTSILLRRSWKMLSSFIEGLKAP